ncbi:SDR family oxidoreductase [Rhizosphaericola mali]|uniref:SDR family oxidoreductase n=1 Tax=Rhizosphaericola mali TaxID=2545455 RepID=A0A5P2FZI5_9BACT|nr:SDR family oxidoreductase [Rhizosphaericola mali]QES88936.1 SDR family oxidoreductase [Rhizosphaericola mali]
MKNVFITGANKGIGFETAKQLLQKGYYVYLGSRNVEAGEKAVADLKLEGLNNVECIQIDVTDEQSVLNARKEVGEKTGVVDVLINNAGISGVQFDSTGKMIPQTAADTSVAIFKEVYDINVYGVIRTTQAFLDLLQKTTEPRIVMVSSSQGSITLHSDPNYIYYHYKGAAYLSSKAALNMYTVNLAYELRESNFKINAVSPGFTKTDFNYNRGVGTVEDAGKRIVKYAIIDQDGPTGKFFCEETNPNGGEIPW